MNGRLQGPRVLDLQSDAGRAALSRLLPDFDLLVEGFGPGVMEKLGLGAAGGQAVNPRLVFGRMTGFGQAGPLALAAGQDLNSIALAGVLKAMGSADHAPAPPLNLVGDRGGGALYLAFGLLAALLERQRSGRGQVADAAMVDGAASPASLYLGAKAAGARTRPSW